MSARRAAPALLSLLSLLVAPLALLAEVKTLAYFVGPEARQAVVSPGGDFVAVHHRRGVVDHVVVHHTQSVVTAQIAKGSGRVTDMLWADDDTLLLMRDGGPIVTDVRFERGALRHERRQLRAGQIVNALPKHDDTILYAPKGENAVYRVRLGGLPEFGSLKGDDGAFEEKVAALKLPVFRWISDAEGRVRAASTAGGEEEANEQTVQIWYRSDEDAPWRAIRQAEDSTRLIPLGFAGLDRLLVATDLERDRYALFEMSPATGVTEKLVYEHATAQIVDVLYDHSGARLLGVVRFENGEQRHHYFTGLIANRRGTLEGEFPEKRVVVTSADRKGRFVSALVSSPGDPGGYYLHDAESGNAKLLAIVAPWLEEARLVDPEVVEVEAEDGLPIQGFLTLPGTRGPAPLVVMPHGGPIGIRDENGFDPAAQFLASRGIGVLRVNYRGSSGYGRSFIEAGKKAWGGAIEDDIERVLARVIESGRVDESRICIAGASYGGYSALMSVVRFPGRYVCAATFAGVTDIGLMFNSSDFSWTKGGKEMFAEIVGDPDEERERLRQTSPVYRAREIGVPVQLAHGLHDRRVDVEHAFRLKAMFDLHGTRYEWLLLKDAWHGFRGPREEARYFEALEAFLAGHLGSRP